MTTQEYTIRVTTSIAPDVIGRSWTVSRRYSDFDILHRKLSGFLGVGDLLHLPAKRMFGNLDRDFIAERQNGLQVYMDVVLADPMLACSRPVIGFLCADQIKLDHQERALQYISMEFRCDSPWDVVHPCTEMGLRLRKTYIVVNSRDSIVPGKLSLACWNDYGTELTYQIENVPKALKSLQTLKHPNIVPVELVTTNNNGAFIIRPLCEQGSLRDLINKVKPQAGSLKKYGNHKMYTKLPLETIRVFSRQILEALRFIHAKGWPYGHLHTRNILILRSDLCALTDVENHFLGHSPQLRVPYLLVRRTLSLEQLDVYCFGRCLFEMVFGYPLKRHTLDGEEINCSSDIRNILESLLTADGIKEGIPSVEVLLKMSFFASAPGKLTEKPIWKIPRETRETVSQVAALTLQSLADDAALVRATRQRRHTEARLEEEKRQRKHRDRRKQRAHTTVYVTTSGGSGSGGATGDTDSAQNVSLNNSNNSSNYRYQPPSNCLSNDTSPSATTTNSQASLSPRVMPGFNNIDESMTAVKTSATRHQAKQTTASSSSRDVKDAEDNDNGSVAAGGGSKSALLSAIGNFNKKALKKTVYIADKSSPKL